MSLTPNRRHVCILTPGQLGSNPRVVKEARALSEAGYRVTVIATRVLPEVEDRDLAILDGSPWQTLRLRFDRKVPRRVQRAIQEATALSRRWLGGGARRDAAAYSFMAPMLMRAAQRVPADLYIAHYVAALPAAAAAAARHGARFAFDAEDYHQGDGEGDLRDETAWRRQRALVAAIEARHLPGCAYVTAASPGIADAYAATYGIAPPHVVLNVFPRSQAPAAATAVGMARPGPSLYWFSQTIGPNRGLECAIAAIARTRSRPHLYMRGHVAGDFDRALREVATAHGVADRISFLPPVRPDELERLASAYDIGLCGEATSSRGRCVALSNKLFSFLLAGIAVVASATPAQSAFAEQCGEAVTIYRPDDPADLARALDALLCDAERLARARLAAWHLGQSKYCWDREQDIILDLVAEALARGKLAA